MVEGQLRLAALSPDGDRLCRGAVDRRRDRGAPQTAAIRCHSHAVRAALVFFKYTDFLYRDLVGPLFGFHDKILDLPLPLGVSFVTFTLTAYVVDIYRGTFQGRVSPTTLTGYVLFFPNLIAGPILRPIELIPQLRHPRSALSAHFYAGLAIFTMGLVKKLVFADQIAGVVDAAYFDRER